MKNNKNQDIFITSWRKTQDTNVSKWPEMLLTVMMQNQKHII